MIDDDGEQIVRTRAIRSEPCINCRGKIVRNDPMVRFWGVPLHAWCFDAWRAEHGNELERTQRELFWSFTCRECGAEPLGPCVGQSGVHQARVDLYASNKRHGVNPNEEKLSAWRRARGMSWDIPKPTKAWKTGAEQPDPRSRAQWAMPYVP